MTGRVVPDSPAIEIGAATGWGDVEATPSSAPGSAAHFRPDVEGLRAVAVLAVLAFHARVPGVAGGFVGVDVFYVISGYLITGLLLRELRESGSVALLDFYARRARRLLPAALAVIAATVALSAVVLTRVDFVQVAGDAAAASLYVSNLRFAATATDYFALGGYQSPLLHYWSLAVEEQFYLFWPLLIWLAARTLRMQRLWLVIAAVGLVSFVASLAIASVEPALAFYSLPTRAWELAIGGLLPLGLVPLRRRLPSGAVVALALIGVALIVVAAIAAPSTGPFRSVAGLPAALGAAAVIVSGEGRATVVSRVLSAAVPRWLGRISYSLYLWHWPLLVLVPPAIGHHGLGTRLALAAGAIVVAALSTRLIEDPFRYRWRTIGPRRALAGGLAASALLAGTLTVVAPSPAAVARHDPDPGTELAQLVPQYAGRPPADLLPSLQNAKADLPTLGIAGCAATEEGPTPTACIAGDLGSPTTVVVIGDSKAAQWAPAIELLATERHWRLIRLIKWRCPFVAVTVWDPLKDEPYLACDAWNAFALRTIRIEQPSIVFVSSRRPSDLRLEHGIDMAIWERALADQLRAAAAEGQRVIYLGDTPHLRTDPVRCLERERLVERCRPMPVPSDYQDLESAATTAAGVQLVRTTDWLCRPSGCPLVLGRYLLYVDQYHLTVTASRLLAPQVGLAVDQP